MTLDIFSSAYKSDRQPIGGLIGGSLGSTIIVANTNAEQATSEPTDPWAAYGGLSTNHGNIRPIAIPNDFYQIDLMAIWSDAIMPVSTAPIVRVFGRVPRWSVSHFWPETDDPTSFGDVGAQSNGHNFWIPLPASGAATAPITLDVSEVCSHLRKPTNGDTFSVGLATTVPTRGCDLFIVNIATAGAFDETSSSSSSSSDSTDPWGGPQVTSNKLLIGARLIG